MPRHLKVLVFVLASVGSVAHADSQLSKEACVDAHSRGQDARESGKLSLARKLFLTCAQTSCPSAVQGDCARFADDLTSMQPTVVFAARDGSGNDLPNTTVYVDGALVATTIDGKPHDLDPGNHVVKFSSGDRDEAVTVVIGSGEKGRVVQARFPGPNGSRDDGGASAQMTRRDRPAGPTVKRPTGSLALAIGGGVLLGGGVALAVYGRASIPAACDLGTLHCGAPPGDPVFDQAKSAAQKMNYGLVMSGIGATALVGGLVWYVVGAKQMKETPITSWVTSDSAGFSVLSRF